MAADERRKQGEDTGAPRSLALVSKQRCKSQSSVSKESPKSDLEAASNEREGSHELTVVPTNNTGLGAKVQKLFRNSNGQTPVARACTTDDLEQLALVLKKWPEQLNEPDDAGNTPLQIAAHSGHTNIVQLLLDKGCVVDCQNADGDTPLMDAAKNGHSEVVTLLFNAGADLGLCNGEGSEPLDLIKQAIDEDATIRNALNSAEHKYSRPGAPIVSVHQAAGTIRKDKQARDDTKYATPSENDGFQPEYARQDDGRPNVTFSGSKESSIPDPETSTPATSGNSRAFQHLDDHNTESIEGNPPLVDHAEELLNASEMAHGMEEPHRISYETMRVTSREEARINSAVPPPQTQWWCGHCRKGPMSVTYNFACIFCHHKREHSAWMERPPRNKSSVTNLISEAKRLPRTSL